MIQKFSTFLDRISEFTAHRKGLLPMIGLLCVVINFILQVFPAGWIASTNLFLHLGVILGILGLMLARAL
jgi:hypothetical protein